MLVALLLPAVMAQTGAPTPASGSPTASPTIRPTMSPRPGSFPIARTPAPTMETSSGNELTDPAYIVLYFFVSFIACVWLVMSLVCRHPKKKQKWNKAIVRDMQQMKEKAENPEANSGEEQAEDNSGEEQAEDNSGEVEDSEDDADVFETAGPRRAVGSLARLDMEVPTFRFNSASVTSTDDILEVPTLRVMSSVTSMDDIVTPTRVPIPAGAPDTHALYSAKPFVAARDPNYSSNHDDVFGPTRELSYPPNSQPSRHKHSFV